MGAAILPTGCDLPRASPAFVGRPGSTVASWSRFRFLEGAGDADTDKAPYLSDILMRSSFVRLGFPVAGWCDDHPIAATRPDSGRYVQPNREREYGPMKLPQTGGCQ